MTTADVGIPELVIGDRDEAVLALLRELQRSVLVHSEAARALFGALVSEGQLFAQTTEGKRWKDRLVRSTLLERALLVWQGATLFVLEESRETVTPSAVIDAVASASSERRDALLERLFSNLDGTG